MKMNKPGGSTGAKEEEKEAEIRRKVRLITKWKDENCALLKLTVV